MTTYIIRRLLLMFPTLIGILTITFIVVQFVPGGPIDQMRSLLRGHAGAMGEAGGGSQMGGAQGLKAQEMDPKYLEELKKTYHLDRPLWERYLRTFIWYSPKDMKQPFTERFFNHD
ncbi:MAG: microcin ABC transporter permease, partial [Nitrospinota bacterium]|nr:microcin ABC transporter permease [Nitrospinota bacterium]